RPVMSPESFGISKNDVCPNERLLFRRDEDEELAGLDHVARLGVNFLDSSRDLGCENVLHLHGFQYEQRITRNDFASKLGGDLKPLAGDGRRALGVALRSSPPPRPGLRAELEREALPPDRDAYAIGAARVEEANGPTVGAYGSACDPESDG